MGNRSRIGCVEDEDRVVFSPDSTRVLTGSTATTMRLWDAQRGTEVAVLGGQVFPDLPDAFTDPA